MLGVAVGIKFYFYIDFYCPAITLVMMYVSCYSPPRAIKPFRALNAGFVVYSSLSFCFDLGLAEEERAMKTRNAVGINFSLKYA